jgi:hypothetical protein
MSDRITAETTPQSSVPTARAGLDEAIDRAVGALLARQHADGHWVFELEADVTIPAEYILLQHYLGRIEPERQARIASGKSFALRIDMTQAVARAGPLEWEESETGRVSADPLSYGDVVLARKDTPASYHLAVTVDDAIQGVTLVTRGADLFSATHVHRLLQALLELPTPR